MINLTEQEVQNLMNFINDMPTKFGAPLLSFFNQKLMEANAPQDDDKTEIDD